MTVLLKIYIREFILKAAACSEGWVLWSLKSTYNCVGWMQERDDVASAEATIKPFRFLLEGAVAGNSGYRKACNPNTGPPQGSLRAVRVRRWTAALQKQGQVQVKWLQLPPTLPYQDACSTLWPEVVLLPLFLFWTSFFLELYCIPKTLKLMVLKKPQTQQLKWQADPRTCWSPVGR